MHTESTALEGIDKFFVTRQIDFDVKDKVNWQAFREAALLIELPKVITNLKFVSITLICQAPDNSKTEIWEYEGGAYITIFLPYQFVMHHSEAEVTQRFLEVYKDFIDQVEYVPPIETLEE